jgi:RNA polymerase sigma factor (TIGR02999 family)
MRDVDRLTELLELASSGDSEAAAKLGEATYQELRALARHALRPQRQAQTLCTTALVHEAYLRMAGRKDVVFENRRKFFAFAARIMRSVLVDEARERQAGKRGGGAASLPLEEVLHTLETSQRDLLELNEALDGLFELDDRLGRLVELRFFSGLNVEEAAEVLDISVPTAVRDWRTARAWLRKELVN